MNTTNQAAIAEAEQKIRDLKAEISELQATRNRVHFSYIELKAKAQKAESDYYKWCDKASAQKERVQLENRASMLCQMASAM